MLCRTGECVGSGVGDEWGGADDAGSVVERGPSGNRESKLTLNRRAVERVLLAAEHLAAPDRALVQNVLDRGVTPTELARSVGCEPRRIRRRLQRLIEHVDSDLFRFVAGHQSGWPERRKQIAAAVILRGRSQRAAAREIGTTVHQVRRELDRVRFLCEEARKQQRTPSRRAASFE